LGKKLEGNGMWESSRMMLPEHREAILDQTRNKDNKKRNELDEQELLLIETTIHQSMQHHQTLTFSLYDPHEDLKVIGLVERVDQRAKQIRVDGEWFDMRDIVAVEGLQLMENDLL
jgi:hypothetical protein